MSVDRWACIAGIIVAVSVVATAQDVAPVDEPDLKVEHADCDLFVHRDRWIERRDRFWRSDNTERVTRIRYRRLNTGGDAVTRQATPAPQNYTSTIDRNIFGELARKGVAPAPRTTDAEFLRRVTLDLTGRIPTRERVLSFLADTTPDKRSRLVDELLATPEFVDKWTMYFGDQFRNAARSQAVTRSQQGRMAFYNWIKDAVAKNKPYDQMARELITATGSTSFGQGEMNFLIGARVTGGPAQDIYDSETALVAETFLGIGHLNCVLCHNGRGHLDSLSLWGKQTQRTQAWEMASFFSRTTQRTGMGATPPIYWYLTDDGTNDYRLNTTTGNRPARQPLANGARTIAPRYIFTDKRPAADEPYRVALARELTADFQFARATVNYVWAEFFTRGIVEPVNQFDPARLDPDNPPPEPWTLQPSNPRLLNDLAADFIQAKYDLRALMRQIVTSEAYQLSSRYDGEWKPEWEPLFARKLVRRLWGEEIHDAIVQASEILPSYNVPEFSGDDFLSATNRAIHFAMQLPEPTLLPDGGGVVTQFLDSFFRGNREDIPRSRDGSVLQSLNLMNDAFVMARTRSTNAASGKLLARALATGDNNQIVDMLFLSVLSRYPSEVERSSASEFLVSAGLGGRAKKAEDLLWSLYNKVDFIFNY